MVFIGSQQQTNVQQMRTEAINYEKWRQLNLNVRTRGTLHLSTSGWSTQWKNKLVICTGVTLKPALGRALSAFRHD